MRKLFNTLFVIIASMVTFAGCAKEEVNAPANETKTVQFIAESIESKTHFGTPENGSYPTLWDNGDKVKVFLNLDEPSGVKKLEATAEIAEISSDSKSATFNAEMNEDYVTNSYTFYAVAPSTAYNARSSSEGRFTVQIPSEQTPQASSVDKAAQVIYAVSETTTSMPSSVSMHFRHMTAYGKFSLTNLSDKVSSISQVKIVAPEGVCLSGKWNYMIADGSIVAHGDNISNFVTIKTTNTENIWFACAPVDASGMDVKFIVKTDQGDLEKTVEFPKAFEPGKIATFAVNMSGIEPPVQEETTQYYQKVTSDLDDWSGKYLIVFLEKAHATISGKDLVSTRDVTITDDKIAASSNLADAVMTVTKSGEDYYMTFPDGKYFGMAKNTSTATPTKFALAFNNTDNGVKISGVVSDVTYILYSNSGQYFRCYVEKTEANYTLPTLYKLVEDGETPDVPTAPILTVTPAIIEIGCAGGNEELSYTVTNPSDGVSVAVSTTAEWIAIDDSTEGKVIISVAENTLTEVREATISLSYEGAETMTVVVTQKAWVDTSKIEELTVADFLAKDVNTDVWYKLTGTISNLTNTDYGNFDLVDETGNVYVYGLTADQVDSNDNSFSSLGLKEGDQVTLIGTRADYKGTAQVGGPAYYVSHVSACAAPVISCADNTVTITAEAGATIYYTTNGDEPSTSSAAIYESAFEITETVTVKAIAVADGKVQSLVAEKSCTWVDPNAGTPDTQEYTYSWTATSGALGTVANGSTTRSLSDVDWTISRSDNTGYTGWTSNVIQIGSKNNPENLTLKTSGISGTIKSVLVECASYSAKHNISISVGGVSYASEATPNWTNNTVGTVSCEGNATGDIEIKFEKGTGSRALYIKSIKIVYEN